MAKFLAYQAFGPEFFGRWSGWYDYSLYIPNRIAPYPLFWDGGSAEAYLASYYTKTDSKVMSPQIESMNWDFMAREAQQLNPNFWFEISTWYDTTMNLSGLGPDRYSAMVQFIMWLNRPRTIRDFYYSNQSQSTILPWFNPVMDAVDRVYSWPVLTQFWRDGQLVVNPSRPHPYQSGIPVEYSSVDRMFLLTTNVDPAQPWSYSTNLPVFSIARVLGVAPNRNWLIYAHSPQGNRTGVQITIPGYRAVPINVSTVGSFYLVSEATGSVTPVTSTTQMPTGGSSDTIAPSVPTNLVASAVSSSQINLAWSTSADNVGVIGYKVFRNGVQVGSPLSPSYSDTGLAPGTTYRYAVSAYDAAGNTSLQSGNVSATTGTQPTPAVNLAKGKLPIASGAISGPSPAAAITDEDIHTANWVGVGGSGKQWIRLDLGQSYLVSDIKLWHYYGDARAYHDVVVQLSNDVNFSTGVTTVFNNDANNTCGQGRGKDAEYTETAAGKDIRFAPVNARYVRLWSNGNTYNPYSHYIEVEVFQ